MSEKTKEVPKLADATYAHTLIIKSTYSGYREKALEILHRHCMNSFTMQTLSIHCILKFLVLVGFLRHYLLRPVLSWQTPLFSVVKVIPFMRVLEGILL